MQDSVHSWVDKNELETYISTNVVYGTMACKRNCYFDVAQDQIIHNHRFDILEKYRDGLFWILKIGIGIYIEQKACSI